MKQQLYRRYIISSGLCSLCEISAETESHAIFWCTHARELWSGNNGFDEIIGQEEGPSLPEIFLNAANSLDAHDFRTFLALSWASWSCRNKLMFEAQVLNPVAVAIGFVSFVESWVEYNGRRNPTSPTIRIFQSNDCWMKPCQGTVKINVDAHINALGFVGVGATYY